MSRSVDLPDHESKRQPTIERVTMCIEPMDGYGMMCYISSSKFFTNLIIH